MLETRQARNAEPNRGRKTRAGQGWCMPRPIRNFGEKLMSQQVWCWGRDVEYPDGNLLMKHGFERHRDSDLADRSTCYRLDDGELHVCLWGFGMFFGIRELGGLYLERFEFCPTWAPVESLSLGIHWPDDLPCFARPRGQSQWRRARELRKRSLLWIANYESWVRKHVGIRYRRHCVETWLKPHVRAEKKAAAWRFLSQRSWERQSMPPAKTLQEFTLSAGPR